MSCFLTPAHRMQVKRVCIKPVIIDVIPAVKMHLDSVLLHGCHLGGAHQGRVPFVHSFQFLQRLKTRLGTLEKRMRIATDTTHVSTKGRSITVQRAFSSNLVRMRILKEASATTVLQAQLFAKSPLGDSNYKMVASKKRRRRGENVVMVALTCRQI